MTIDTKAIMARSDAATQGDWRLIRRNDSVTDDIGSDKGDIAYEVSAEDAAFIIASHTDVPALCRAYDEQAKEIERLRGLLKDAWAQIEEAEALCHVSYAEAHEHLQRALSTKSTKELEK